MTLTKNDSLVIEHKIYPEHLIAYAPSGHDPVEWSREVLVPALEAAYAESWPDAQIEIEVVPGASGAGSGVRAIVDGVDDEDLAAAVTVISNRTLLRAAGA